MTQSTLKAKDESSPSNVGCIGIGVLCFALLIPSVQVAMLWWNIRTLESNIVETNFENENLLREINALNDTKTTGISDASRKVGELAGRVERNKELLLKAEDAEKKVELVKSLTEEYQKLTGELDQIKQHFVDVMSDL